MHRLFSENLYLQVFNHQNKSPPLILPFIAPKMEVNSRRKSAPRNAVAAGSVWESRMKMDEVKGGIKVFNGVEETNNADHNASQVLQVSEPMEPSTSRVREKRRTWKPEPVEVIGSNSSQGRKIRLEPNKSASKSFSVSLDGIEKNPSQVKHTRSASHKDINESCREAGVFKDKSVSSSLGSLGVIKQFKLDSSDNDDDDDDDDEEEEEEEEEEDVIENKSFDVKEVDVMEQKPNNVVKEEKKVNQIYRKPVPFSPVVKKQPPFMKVHHAIDQDLNKPLPITSPEESEKFPQNHNKFQNIVDLVMWRDVARSAFVFGLGAFILISFSYTEDFNLSLMSAIGYVGLVYLAGIFFYKTIIYRGDITVDDSIHLIGEEEAILFLRLILPYLNEILLKLKAIFSGDPAATMKLAVLLFVLARCGSFITIGQLVKLGYFGLFTLPKVCSSYWVHLTIYGKFFIQQWQSCSRNKAVAIVAFILVWNFSSMPTRIWAVFMLVVSVRYYQESSWDEQRRVEVEDDNNSPQGGRRLRKQGVWASKVNQVKEKKES